jgi:hypothetical protein
MAEIMGPSLCSNHGQQVTKQSVVAQVLERKLLIKNPMMGSGYAAAVPLQMIQLKKR